MLRSYCHANPTSWSDTLPMLEFAYNNHKHDSTGESPFFLNYGMHPRLPMILDVPTTITTIPNANEIAAQTCVTMANALVTAKQQLLKAQSKQKKYADAHRRDLSFQVNDYVLVSTSKIRGVPKLERPFIGPFKVIKCVNDVAYKLDLRRLTRMPNVFHVSQLHEFFGTPTRIDYLNGEYEDLSTTTAERASSSSSLPIVPNAQQSPSVENNTFFSQLPQTSQITFPSFSDYDLEPCVEISSEPTEDDDLDYYPAGDYPIDKILRCRLRKITGVSTAQNQLEYLVLYKNRPEYEQTWVTADAFMSCPELLAEFDANPVF